MLSPLLANSQTLSNDEQCCVPCIALKNALLVKTERDFLKTQIGITRDSILVLDKVVLKQDIVIKTQDKSINLYKQNELNYTQIIDNKDEEIQLYKNDIKKHKRAKVVSYIVRGTCIILSLLLAI